MSGISEALSDERQVVGALLNEAERRGYLCSVYDGEEWALRLSLDYAAVRAALCTTDMDVLRFHEVLPGPACRVIVADVALIWGNGCDVISDHTDSASARDLLASASQVADELSGVGL